MELDDILASLKAGRITTKDAKKMISLHSIEVIEDMARLDVGRAHRRNIPEVLFAESKHLTDIQEIIRRHPARQPLVISRLQKDHYNAIVSSLKNAGFIVEEGRNCTTVLAYEHKPTTRMGKIGILTAGTSDIPVAEEVRLMCTAMGCGTICRYDVGVAGLHRTLPAVREMINADVDCLVVAAGMEGALATVVASMISIPVIGVPVSVGYGYGSGGTSALSSMLQSCALGLTVVNIDGGIAAGAAAGSISRASRRHQDHTEQG